MRGQILVAKEVIFNEDSKNYSVKNIINRYNIVTLPTICFFNVFVKINDIPSDEPVEVLILVNDNKGLRVGSSEKILIRNPRDKNEIPGIDICIALSLLLLKEGNYFFTLFVDGYNQYTYPLKIFRSEEA